MKTLKNVLLMAAVLVFIASCDNKSEILPSNLSNQVVGTYNGTLTSSISQTEKPAAVDITLMNNYALEVHCYADDFDTIMVLELYPDGDFMRVCFTEDDFEEEYGHRESANHHMMGNSNDWKDWQQHMSEEHNQNDEHYGYFDMDSHKFDYRFRIIESTGNYEQRFIGTKQ